MSDGGFLSRWSRRKRAAEAGIPVEDPQAAPPPAADRAAVPAAPDETPRPVEPEEPPFDLAALPSIETLTAESDFAAFLHKAVPESLRRAALRKAWTLDPTIRDFVGLADYAWDYNAPDGVPGAALHLSGDVKGMVARLFAAADGPPAEVATPAPDAASRDDAAPPAGGSVASDAALPAAVASEPEPPAPGPRLLPGIAEAPAPAVATAAPPDQTVPRRHGSALPS